MYPIKLDVLTDQVIAIAKLAGQFISDEQSKFLTSDIIEKEKNQLVTYVDKTAEQIIVEGLKPLINNAGFICEEGTINQDEKEYQWIIDPLDGTTNFLHGIAVYAVSIALYKNDKPLLGVVYNVPQNLVYHANVEGRAYCENEILKVRDNNDFSKSLIATGFPYTDFSWADNYIEFFKHLTKSTRGLRRLGSAALDLVWVAQGKFDVFYEQSLAPWDVAGGIVIVQQAGGMLSDFVGGTNYLHGRNIVASNGILHQHFLNELQRFL